MTKSRCRAAVAYLLVAAVGIRAESEVGGKDSAPAPAAEQIHSRACVPLFSDWRVVVEGAPRSGPPAIGTSGLQDVELPYTWNARDGQDGGNDYLRTTAWFLREFTLPERDGGRRVFLRVGAANITAQVLLNGAMIGEHRGGFAAFVFELTDAARWEKSNDLAIRVSNVADVDVPPYSADFTFFGGVYRDVSLLFSGPVCISALDHASAGVYLQTLAASADEARIGVRVLLDNALLAEQSVRVGVTLADADSKLVASAETAAASAPPGQSAHALSLAVKNPHLWQGVVDPYLYTATVSLYAGDVLIDQVREPVGIRTFAVDPDRGFLLNGKPYPLRGVNRHQDRQDFGWALEPKHHEEDFTIIREMGCTAVRLAHYQHHPYAYYLCDQLGLVVWAEIPLVNRIVDTPAFRDNVRQQLIELIRQNYNHPSICFWGIHNEVTAPWEPGPDPTPLVRDLAALVKAEDPSRRSVCAATIPDDHAANWQTDLIAFNRYFGWYDGAADDFGAWADRVHAAHPSMPMGISEYGAGANVAHHEIPPGKPPHAGPWHPEEYQALYHEVHWRQMATRPYLWGTFVWNMFDFAADQRHEGSTPGRNDKGLVTYDRLVKKDAFYWYKANWSDEPFVYITSRRYAVRDTAVVPVKVYSNCSAVALSVGNETYAAQSSDDRVFEWPVVRLVAGANTIRAVGTHPRGTVEDRCVWQSSAGRE